MKNCLLAFFCFLAQGVSSQELGLSETIDYINQNLKDNPIYKDDHAIVVHQISIVNGMLSVTQTNNFSLSDGERFRFIDKFSIPVTQIRCIHLDKTNDDFPGEYGNSYLSYSQPVYSRNTVFSCIYIACDSCPDKNKYGITKCVKKEYYTVGSYGFKEEDKLIDKDFFYYRNYGLMRAEYFSKYKDGRYNPYFFDGTYLRISFDETADIKNNLLNAFNHLIYLAQQEIENDPFAKPVTHSRASGSDDEGKKNVITMTKSNDGTYEIPVQINGVLKIKFVFDSGASDVSISPDVALTLIKTGTVTSADFVGTQKYVFADGTTATSKVFIIKNLKIGSKTVYNVRASISSSIDAPMLLGQSVLQKFGKFSIDNNAHTITID